jgi:hypothetical protein
MAMLSEMGDKGKWAYGSLGGTYTLFLVRKDFLRLSALYYTIPDLAKHTQNSGGIMTGFHPVWDKKVEKNPSLVLIYGSVELYRFIRRKKTVGVNFRILSERSLQLE